MTRPYGSGRMPPGTVCPPRSNDRVPARTLAWSSSGRTGATTSPGCSGQAHLTSGRSTRWLASNSCAAAAVTVYAWRKCLTLSAACSN